VKFKDGSTVLGTAFVEEVNGKYVATWTTSTLAVGAHSITAAYSGDNNWKASASTALSLTVAKAKTQTFLTGNINPAVYGQAVTLTAALGIVAPGAGTLSGTVTFKDGLTVLGTAPVETVGGVVQATFTTTKPLAVGKHSFTAFYNGDVHFRSSTSAALKQTVNKAGTATTLSASLETAQWGEAVTLTALIAALEPGTGLPTGTVTFKNGSTVLKTVTLKVVNGVATAAFTTIKLPVGIHELTVTFNGSGKYNASTSVPFQLSVTA